MALEQFLNTYAGNPLDRASERRGDEAWLAEQLASDAAWGVAAWNGKFLVVDEAGGPKLARLSGGLTGELAGGGERLLFLGLDAEGAPAFAVDLEGLADPAEAALQGFGRFEELRPLAMTLPAEEAAIAATTRAVFEWRRRHMYCSACGQPSRVAEGGWKRVCPACETQHFPRTDPVVIMLPYHGDRCLLGRNARFTNNFFSALAGFLEPGETIEEACAREMKEEAGLTAVKVAYHSSQPWPFPASLMIGLLAEVAEGEAAPDQTELAEVRWFTRAQARDLLAGRIEDVRAPNPSAIAHQLLKAWAEAE